MGEPDLRPFGGAPLSIGTKNAQSYQDGGRLAAT